MSAQKLEVRKNTYLDSVKLLAGARAAEESPGVEWAAVVMATPANVEDLKGEGFDAAGDLTANDLVMAVRASEEDALGPALEAAADSMFTQSSGGGGPETETQIRSLDEAARLPEPANLALVSVPGEYAALETQKALSAGMDVLLFSDNVDLDHEVEMKERARSLGRFVMGPGAGTAMIDGVGLGFSNVVRRGSVGIVAAAGTGAQEAMALVHRAGLGVTQVIGVGGRDLSETVGGIMTSMGIAALDADPDTDGILVVSKPPSPEVADRVLDYSGSKPMVAALVGLDTPITVGDVIVKSTLEDGVTAMCEALGVTPPWASEDPVGEIADTIGRLNPDRTAIRGLFSGGTLCFEAMTLMAAEGLEVFSNTPLRPEWTLDDAGESSHICVDMGEEEFTQNRPHPMIDPQARIEAIKEHGKDPKTAVILVDVVLGHGSHDDPAGELAAVLGPLASDENGPAVVAYVLGTDEDPQNLEAQRDKLRQAGCLVAPTNRRAALTAVAIAKRTPTEGTQ